MKNINSQDTPEKPIDATTNRDDLAIYIHWPYCARICPYCDFNVYKAKGADKALSLAIAAEIRNWHDVVGDRRINSVHFGGGTPSLLAPEQIENILTQIDDLWGISKACEIGLEANPNDGQAAYWRELSHIGVNRLSLGVQSFNDEGLTALGRDHDSHAAKQALDLALAAFPSVSLDLIYGWQGQTLEHWRKDIDYGTQSGAPHVSTYQLTIEPNTAFGRKSARGMIVAADEALSADMYELVANQLTMSGYTHYEVSNFAKPNHRSAHNMAYWLGDDYLGLGPGAHGRITMNGVRRALVTEAKPKNYINKVEQTGFGIASDETLTHIERAEEYVIMGLRISEGISLSRYQKLAGHPLDRQKLERLSQRGLILESGDRLAATDLGRRVLDSVTHSLLID